MKRLFIFTLAYYLGLHVIAPWIYYQLFGYVYIYSSAISLYFPEKYMDMAALVIGIPIVLTMIIVAVLPIGKGKIEASLNRNASLYFWIGVIFTAMQFRQIGAYANSAIIHGTLWAYMSFFFDMGVLLLIFFLTGSKENNFLLLGAAYLGVTLMASSRQGALILVAVLLAMLYSTDRFMKQRKRIYIFILCLCIIAPVGYVYSTQRRGSPVREGKGLVDQIVGRCSDLELLGLALYEKESDIWREDVFKEKYSFENQLKLSINSLVIGDVFEGDVNPNQYYRTVFLEVPEQQSKETYTSANLTLPGYFYLKYPLIVSWLLVISILLILYIIFITIPWHRMFAVVYLFFGTTALLGYFDWVQVLSDFRRLLFTVCAIYFFSLGMKYVPRLRHVKFKLY